MALLLLVVPFAQHRQLRFFYSGFEFGWFWSIASLVLAAYIAEWTRHEWFQLQAIKKLRLLPTSLELQTAMAREKLYFSVLNAGLLCCCFCLLAYLFPRGTYLGFPGSVVWFLPVAAGGAVFLAWRGLQLITARAS